jgi:mRNA-degrading endonuclease RelE of RelBE toxin-antitoxin system
MAPLHPYHIVFRRAVKTHLAQFKRHQIVEIRTNIEKLLKFEPTRITRNRKPLEEEKERFEDSEWELRTGQNNRFRVFYRVDEMKRVVVIIAIGEKVGNQLYIGGEEYP